MVAGLSVDAEENRTRLLEHASDWQCSNCGEESGGVIRASDAPCQPFHVRGRAFTAGKAPPWGRDTKSGRTLGPGQAKGPIKATVPNASGSQSAV